MDYILSNKKVIYKGSNVDIEKVRAEMYRRQRAVRFRKAGIRLAANIIVVWHCRR